MKGFQTFSQANKNRYSEAKKWEASGGKVVGYISGGVPEEIIMAAGLFPLRLAGDIHRETSLADEYMEFNFDPIVRSLYDMLLCGEFDFLDSLVIPHISESIFKLYYYLMENKRNGDPPHLPDVYLLDLLYTRWWRTGRYNLARLHDFKKKMETIAGKAVSDHELGDAIATVNENRRLMREITRKRRHLPPLISGADALEIGAASTVMRKTDHNLLLKDLLDDETLFTPKAPARLMFYGNPLDGTDLYRLIEGCDATIILENHDWGSWQADHEVTEDEDPMSAISEKYHLHAIGPRVFPAAAFHNENLATAIETAIDGAIFFFPPHSAASWDYPEQKVKFEREGIKTLLIQSDKDILRNTKPVVETVQDFVSGLS